MRKLNVIVFLIFLLFPSCEEEKTIDVTSRENLDKVIESEFKKYLMPGIAYIAVKEDSIVYVGAKGYANIHDSKLMTPDTRMLIASVSKTMVVTAIMQLYEKGLILLDEDINSYLPFQVTNPKFPNDKITVKMLLTHTSSISDDGYPGAFFYLFGYVDYPESLMSFERNYLTRDGQYYTKSNFMENKPGTKYLYSNVGAALLACLVEHMSGTDYNTYCKQNIFLPLGMTRTSWFFSETPEDEMAIPYTDNKITNPRNPFFTFPTYPDGHLITTVEDLSKFLRAYIQRGTFNNKQILKPETADLITEVHFDGADEPQGLIFYETNIGEFKVWGHNGGDPGVSTEMYYDKTSKTGYIVFINRSECVSKVIGNALLKYAIQ